MRFHAVVHDENNKNKSVYECHIMADDSSQAREKIKKYLQKNDQHEQAKMQISLVEYREDIRSNLPLID